MKTYICCFLFLFISFSLSAQKTKYNRNDDPNLTIESILRSNTLDGFMPVQVSSRKDNLGRTHLKYKYYKDELVLEGIDLNIHLKNNGDVYLFNGSPLHGRYKSRRSTSIPDKQITEVLLKYVGENFKTYDFNTNVFQKDMEFSRSFSRLIYYSPDLDGDISKVHQCHEIIVKANGDIGPKRLFVSSESGDVLEIAEHVHGIGFNVPTLYYGEQVIEITEDFAGQLTMEDEVRDITTYYSNAGSTDDGVIVSFTSNFDQWVGDTRAVADVHYGSAASYDYFDNTFDWQSFDGSGSTSIKSYYITGEDNAFFNPMLSALVFGDGGGTGPFSSPLATLEIAGHEFMHGIVHETGNLYYGQEPGAINESYSDIFGMAVQKSVGSGVDWIIGEECTDGVGIRSFMNPSDFNQPNCYEDTLYQATNNGNPSDEFGVHTNSGVMNFWFYLLNVGGSSENCNDEQYTVQPVSDFVPNSSDDFGIMTELLFRGLVDGYVGLNTGFEDMREATDAIAHDLGYSCAFRQNLLAAWHAVGVGLAPDFNCEIFPNLTAILPTFPCPTSEIKFSVTPASNTYTYNWDMGDMTHYPNAGSDLAHTFAIAGSYVVEVVLIDASMGPGNEVSAFDQFALSILPDCNPDPGNDCSVSAGPQDFLCFGETEIQLMAPSSVGYSSTPNVSWSAVSAPGGINVADLIIVDGGDPFMPTVNFGGEAFPEGVYIFEICVDCSATTGAGNHVRKCSQSAVITVSEPPSQPEILDVQVGCSEILLEVVEPTIYDELDFHITPTQSVSVEYIPGSGFLITRDRYSESDNRYWRNYFPHQYKFYYTLIRNGCALQSEEIDLTFVDTQYGSDGEVDVRIREIDGVCYGPLKILEGSRPGADAEANWEVVSQPEGPNLVLNVNVIGNRALAYFEVEGWYTFEYSVSQNEPCHESTKTIYYYYQDLEILKPNLSGKVVPLCSPITEVTTFSHDMGLMENVTYSYKLVSQIVSGSIEITSPNNNDTDIIVTPGSNGQLELNNGAANIEMLIVQYLFKPDCNESFIEVVPLPYATPEENFTHLNQTLEEYVLDYLLNETSCFDGVTGQIEIEVSTSDDLGITITVDDLPFECEDIDPCIIKCSNLEYWEIVEGGLLEMRPDLNIFCDNGSSIYSTRMSAQITSPKWLDGQVWTISNVEAPTGVMFPDDIRLNTILRFPEDGHYTFLVKLEYFSPTGILICEDIGFFNVNIGEAFDPCAGDDQQICPQEVFTLNGCPAPAPFESLEGTWYQISGNVGASLVDIHDPNTSGYFPASTCDETVTFMWRFKSSSGSCDALEAETSVHVLADGEGTCVCCSNPSDDVILINWLDESNGVITIDATFKIDDIDEIDDVLVDFEQGVVSNETMTIVDNYLQWVGELQLGSDQTDLCFEVDFLAETTCPFAFCEDICIWTEGAVCPTTRPCSDELDIAIASMDCATNERGELFYEFDIRIWDPEKLAEPLTVVSNLGSITNVVVDSDYKPELPELTRITGFLIPSSDITDLEACFTLQFANETLCNITDCYIVPECLCAISNEVVEWPDCIYPWELTCFELSFDYFGPDGRSIDFYLDENNSSYGWDFISATNITTGQNIIEQGTNTFNLCFMYGSECKDWGIDLFFDAIIEGVGCKLWEMHVLYCCDSEDCNNSNYSYEVGCNDENGIYTISLDIETIDGFNNEFNIKGKELVGYKMIEEEGHLFIKADVDLSAHDLDEKICFEVEFINSEQCNVEICFVPSNCPIIEKRITVGRLNENDLNIFPNPFSETLTIELRSSELGESLWTLFDVNGRLIYQSLKPLEKKNEEFNIDLTDYNSGLYYLKVILPDGSSLIKKVVKSR